MGARQFVSKPVLHAKNPDVVALAEQSWKALANMRPRTVFRFASGLVRVQEGPTAVLQALTLERLGHELLRAAKWITTTPNGEEIPGRPPRHLLQDMLAHPDPPMPSLVQVVSMPVFTSSGELIVTPGYDEESGIFLVVPSDLEDWTDDFKTIQHPSRDDVKWAIKEIEELLHDFPFVGPADKAHTIALFLLPFVRSLITGPTPLHLMFKPTAGTGATLLAKVLTEAVTGAELTIRTLTSWPQEQQRTLTAALLEGPAYLLLDNVHELDSATLAGALTAGCWSDRRMGSSETASIPVRCAWIATGNNPTLSSELRRRTIPIRLDARMEHPEAREHFRHPNLPIYVKEHRPLFVRAAIILVRAWQAAGQPRGTRTLGMYESWAQVLGGILDVTGVSGLLTNLDELRAPDAEAQAWSQFFARWWEEHEGAIVGVSDVFPLIDSETDGPIDLGLDNGHQRTDDSQKMVLGKRLSERRDRIIGGYRLVEAGKAQRAQQWRLVLESAGEGSE
jgi:hypothetical protein